MTQVDLTLPDDHHSYMVLSALVKAQSSSSCPLDICIITLFICWNVPIVSGKQKIRDALSTPVNVRFLLSTSERQRRSPQVSELDGISITLTFDAFFTLLQTLE